MHRVRMLIHFGVTPYIVFDGDYLPSKGGTEKERAAKRKESKRLGLELLKVGKTSQAHLELQKAVDVTPEMARLFIEELKYHNIQYVVAPYEADSQLAYLERRGIINGILSEDSDLLVFGAKCLITKLDKYGQCVEINRNHFTACREISLVGWSDADFRRMAMLSGCDYLPGIGKMGLKTAYRMLRKHKTIDRLVKAAQFDGQFKVPSGYMEAFQQAELTFLYQWVFCPISNQLVNLTAPEPGIDVHEMPFIGKPVPADVAIGVSNGNLHPHTKEPMTVAPVDRSRSKPLRPARRATVSAQTPDLKQTKPIDSFFKPRRTPLAELDPNSFTPSPSQQALLEQQQNSGGWAAVLAPTAQYQPRSSISRTAPQPARRAISDSLERASAPHPSKRQRLCSDNFDTPVSGKVEVERSRFFASSLPDPSPSLRTANKNKKSSHDIEVYSDGSIDEAMAELVDLEEAASQPKKKMSIFRDDFHSSINSESQSTAVSRTTTQQSQDTNGPCTPATSFGSPEPETREESVFSVALSSQIKDLRSRFSFKASATSIQSSSPAIPTKVPAKSIIPPLPLAKSEADLVEAAYGPSQTPPRKTPVSEFKTPRKDVDELEDSAWAAVEAEIVVAASSPIKPPTSRKLEAKGSEDLIVPDSEAESDCSPRRPRLDLGRFAFHA